MNTRLYDYFTADHRRIEDLFDRATEDVNNVKEDLYHQFRTGLLRHIKMEEKILFPAAQKGNGGEPLPLAAKLRLDHGALTSLMVVPPTPEVIKVLRHVMEEHDFLEEKPAGMYEACENLTADETDNILEELAKVTEVPVHPFNTAPYALEAAKRSLLRAGFDFDEIVKKA
ncbi:MAG: hemerythrin domain-containing protein [Chitinophagaceae bacterium]|nr:hemerythrin domain-containing protein [Chitinophagaceae bacterium]